MEQVKDRLLADLREVEEELARITERLEVRGDYGFGKGDPSVYQWEFNLALRDRYRNHLDQIQSALARLAEGTYGICESCAQTIEAERLDALPFTSLCIACARKSR